MSVNDAELQPTLRALSVGQGLIFTALCLLWGINHNFGTSLHIPLSVATAFSAMGCVAIFAYRSKGLCRHWLLGQRSEALSLLHVALGLGIVAALSPIAYMLLDDESGSNKLFLAIEQFAYGVVYVCLALLLVVTVAPNEKRFRLIGLPLCVVLLVITTVRDSIDHHLVDGRGISIHSLRLIPPFQLSHQWSAVFSQLLVLALISLAALVVVFLKRQDLPRG